MEQGLGKKHKKVDNVKNDEEKPCKKEKTRIKKCVTKTTKKNKASGRRLACWGMKECLINLC